jgi:putative transposase
MPRRARSIVGGLAYHILNRRNGRGPLFRKDEDYLAFERIVQQAQERQPLRLLAWCLMPNHWHFVVWSRKWDGSNPVRHGICAR